MSFNIANSIALEILGVKYVVKYPTVGQLIDIENKKMLLTSNQYGEYVAAPVKTKSLAYLIEVVDAISHFSVLIPDLSTTLSKSYFDIDPLTAKEIVKAYKQNFRPWYDEFMKAIHEESLKNDDN